VPITLRSCGRENRADDRPAFARRRSAPVDREFNLRARRRVGSNPNVISPIGASHCHTPIDADCPPSGGSGRKQSKDSPIWRNSRRIQRAFGPGAGWGGSGTRTCLCPDSLLTGNFTGKFGVSTRLGKVSKRESLPLKALLANSRSKITGKIYDEAGKPFLATGN